MHTLSSRHWSGVVSGSRRVPQWNAVCHNTGVLENPEEVNSKIKKSGRFRVSMPTVIEVNDKCDFCGNNMVATEFRYLSQRVAREASKKCYSNRNLRLSTQHYQKSVIDIKSLREKKNISRQQQRQKQNRNDNCIILF